MGDVPSRVRAASRKLGLGRLYYRLFYEPPLGLPRIWSRQGYGPTLRWRAGRDEMARRLPAFAARYPSRGDGDRTEVHFLTGRSHWLMTAYCYLSLRRHADTPLRPVVHDDGSLTDDLCRRLLEVFPEARIVGAAETEARLDALLPASRHPVLRAWRNENPFFKKLTDVHVGRTGWQLYLDSDMLAFAAPTFLLDWSRRPTRPCCMLDFWSVYGYSPRLLEELAGRPVPPRVNAGICGLRSDDIDWDRIEAWCRTMREREGANNFAEQAVSAMLMSGGCEYAPGRDYRLVRTAAEAADPTPAALKHYVSWSRPYYYHRAWREMTA